MDLHNMKRKELQRLCKKHNISANLTNLEMVDRLSSLLEVREKEKEKPMRKTRSCLKNSDEMSSENESDVLKRNSKKVRFSPQDDVFQLGERSERGFAVENKGGVGRITRGRASLCKGVSVSPVVMKKKGKRAPQEVEKGDFVVENEGSVSRVTRARASLGGKIVISSPMVMKKRGKRAVQEDQKEDLVVDDVGGPSRVTRARASSGIVISSPVVSMKRGKRSVQEDEKEDLLVENKGGASRVTRARALIGEKMLTSPVVMKKRGKKSVQDIEKGDLAVENKGGASRVTRARAGKQVLISSPVVMKKRGKRAAQVKKKSGSTSGLVVDFTNPAVEEENEVVGVKFLRNRKVENVVSPKNIVRNTQKRSQSNNVKVSENKIAKAGGGFTQQKMGLRRLTRNVNISEESKGLTDETDLKVSRKNTRQSTRQRASAKSIIVDKDKKSVAVEISQPEVVTRQSKRNRQSTDESTRYQTSHGSQRMSVIPQIKKAKMDKPVVGNLGKKNVLGKCSPNESTMPIVLEKGSETGNIRRSKRNAVGDGSLVISEDANDSGTDIKTISTKKPRRDAVLVEEPSQHTGRRVNRKADSISYKIKEEMPAPSEPRTRSGNKQNSFVHSAKNFNISGKLGPSKTTREKASPHHTRELSMVQKRSATEIRQSKTEALTPRTRSVSGQSSAVAVTPRTRTGSRQKSFTHTTKKLKMSGSLGLNKTIKDKESPRQSRELSTQPTCFESESKVRGSESQTPVVHEHSKRFTRSALKGKTDGPAYVRGKIYQKKSQSISKLPLSKVESSLPKEILADVQSSEHEVDRCTVYLLSNAKDLPEDNTACSTPRGSSAKTRSVDLNLQEFEGPQLINVPEASPSDLLKVRTNDAEVEADILTPRGGSPKTSNVDINVLESEGPELINVHEASPSDLLKVRTNDAEQEADISTPRGGCPKTSSVDINVLESEGPELINIHEAPPADPLNLQSNHAVLEVDISTPQGGSPKTSGVVPIVQESEGPELIYIHEASPADPFDVQSNLAELEVDILTPQGGSPKTSSVDHNVQESEGPELINVSDASPANPLNVQSNHRELEVDILTPQGGSPKTSSVDLNVQKSEDPELTNICEPCDTLNLQSKEAVHGDVDEDNTTVTERENSCETNVASPHLVHLKVNAAAGDAFPVDSNALADILLLDQSTSTRMEQRPEPSNDVESISKGIDLNLVFQGPAIPEDEPVCPSPLAEVAEIADNPVTGDIDAKSPPLVHPKSVDNVEIIGDASSIDAGSLDNCLFNVERIISSAIEEKQEVSKNVNHVVAEASTVNEEKLTVEVGDFYPSEQELDNLKHPAEFADTGLDKDSRSVSKEVDKPTFADHYNLTVSTNFKEDKDDMMQSEMSVQAGEQHNTSSKSKMQEKEFPVHNSILTIEEVSILEYELPKQEYSETVTSTVMFSNKEPEDPSSPLRVNEVGSLVVEVNERSKPGESPSCWSSDILKRAALDESPLQKEWDSAISADVSEHDQSKNAKVESEIRKKVGVFDSSIGEMSEMPRFNSSLPLHATEDSYLVAEVKEQKPKDSSSLWSTENIPKRVAKDGSSLHKQRSPVTLADGSEHSQSEDARDESEIRQGVVNMSNDTIRELTEMPKVTSSFQTSGNTSGETCTENELGASSISLKKMSTSEVDIKLKNTVQEYSAVRIEGREEEETLSGGTVENDSERTLGIHGDARHILDNQLPVERECDPMIFREFPSNVDDQSPTPLLESSGKEQGTDMSMVKSSRNFGGDFSSQHVNYYDPLKDICGKEQGTPMSILKSSKKCDVEFSCQPDYITEQGKVCCSATLPQTICGDFTGFDNEMVAELMGSTGRQSSRTPALDNGKFEETKTCTVIIDEVALEDGTDSLKGTSSDLVRNSVEDHGGYCEKLDAEVITYDASEEDRYDKDTIYSCRFEDTIQQFVVNYGETDSNSKVICQENDEGPYLVQLDVDTNNADAPVNLHYGGPCVMSAGETNEAQVSTEELTRIKDVVDADAAVNLEYGHDSLTLTIERNQAQGNLGTELNSRSDEMDGEDSKSCFDNTSSNMLDKSEDAGKELDFFTVSLTEELHNLGEEHAREKGPEAIENQHVAFNNYSTGDDIISAENSVVTLTHLESEENKEANQKVDWYDNNKFDEDFRTES